MSRDLTYRWVFGHRLRNLVSLLLYLSVLLFEPREWEEQENKSRLLFSLSRSFSPVLEGVHSALYATSRASEEEQQQITLHHNRWSPVLVFFLLLHFFLF